jgi:hypothetical protein
LTRIEFWLYDTDGHTGVLKKSRTYLTYRTVTSWHLATTTFVQQLCRMPAVHVMQVFPQMTQFLPTFLNLRIPFMTRSFSCHFWMWLNCSQFYFYRISVKVNFTLWHTYAGTEGKWRYLTNTCTISVLEGGAWSASCPRCITPQERPGTRCTRSWVGPQGQTGEAWKILSPPGLDPWTIQPVASHWSGLCNKVKFVLLHTINGRNRVTVPLILNLGTRWCMLSALYQTALPRWEEPTVFIE